MPSVGTTDPAAANRDIEPFVEVDPTGRPCISTSHQDRPAVSREEALDLYEDMVLERSFEDMCAQTYYRRKTFRFVHLHSGQGAVSTGFIRLLQPSDTVVSTCRDHVHALSKGVPARAVMAELFGKTTACRCDQGGSMHMFSAPYNVLGGFTFISEGIPVVTGATFFPWYRHDVLKEASPGRSIDVTLAFFGDGTCNNDPCIIRCDLNCSNVFINGNLGQRQSPIRRVLGDSSVTPRTHGDL